jgi:hypothetical protein
MSTHIQSVTFPAVDGGPLLEGILHLIPRTDHFFAGRETEVAALVTDFHRPPRRSPMPRRIRSKKMQRTLQVRCILKIRAVAYSPATAHNRPVAFLRRIRLF